MKTLVCVCALFCMSFTHGTAQTMAKLKASSTPIDTTTDLKLGFGQTSGCMRVSFPLGMPETEGKVQFETNGSGSIYIYYDGAAVVRFSIVSCTETSESYIFILDPSEQQGNLSPVQQIEMVRNGNYSCQYSPIVFWYDEDFTDTMYCTF